MGSMDFGWADRIAGVVLHRSTRSLVVLAVLLAAVLTACMGDEDAPTQATATPQPPATASGDRHTAGDRHANSCHPPVVRVRERWVQSRLRHPNRQFGDLLGLCRRLPARRLFRICQRRVQPHLRRAHRRLDRLLGQ